MKLLIVKTPFATLFFTFLLAIAATAAPSLTIGKETISASSSGWVGNVYTFTRVSGTAKVYKYSTSWRLELDNATVAEIKDFSNQCIHFTGSSSVCEDFEIFLTGQNCLLGSGISASSCRKLSIYGPGSLSETVTRNDGCGISSSGDLDIKDGAAISIVQLSESRSRGDRSAIYAKGGISVFASSISAIHAGAVAGDGTISCKGNLRITSSLVSLYSDVSGADGDAALHAGSLNIGTSSVTLLGTRGIVAGNVEIATSALGILADYEAIRADNLVVKNVQGLFVSERDAVTADNVTFASGSTLEIIGNSKAAGSYSAIEIDSTSGAFAHGGGKTKLYAPNGVGIDSCGQVRVTGGELSILYDPDWEDARSFFTASSLANACGTVAQSSLSGGVSFSNLQNFLGHGLVDAYIPLHTMQLSSARPTKGIGASSVSFTGGKTSIWSQSDAGGIVVSGSASKTGGTVTVNGKSWPFNTAKKKYKVAFKANGGKLPKGKKMAAQTMTYGKAAKLRKNVFKRDGYVFLGWATKKNGAVKYKNGQSVKNLRKDGKTTTLYAVWAKKTYKVAFYPNGGRGKMAVQTFTYGKAKKLSANKFKRGKWTFQGWAKSAALAQKGQVAYGDRKAVKNLVKNGKTVKLYAVWSSAPVITITLDPNGGQIAKRKLKVQTYLSNGSYYLDTRWSCESAYTPTRKTYYLKYWYTKKTGGTYFGDLKFTKSTSITLYAHWDPNYCSVDFYSDYDDYYDYWLEFREGKALGALPVPTAPNDEYEFGGWWSEPGGRGFRITASTIANDSLPDEVYAYWVPPVYFYDGESLVDTIHFKNGETMGSLPVLESPDKSVWVFDGWRIPGTDTIVTGDTVFDGSFTSLEAEWRQIGPVMGTAGAAVGTTSA